MGLLRIKKSYLKTVTILLSIGYIQKKIKTFPKRYYELAQEASKFDDNHVGPESNLGCLKTSKDGRFLQISNFDNL